MFWWSSCLFCNNKKEKENWWAMHSIISFKILHLASYLNDVMYELIIAVWKFLEICHWEVCQNKLVNWLFDHFFVVWSPWWRKTNMVCHQVLFCNVVTVLFGYTICTRSRASTKSHGTQKNNWFVAANIIEYL